jgi:flagellar hook-associated protein 1 FlgK
VLGADHGTLAVMPDPTDPARSALALTEGATQRPLSEATLGGGCIAGLLRFQNIDLRDARNLAGQYAVAVTGAINAQQALGVNLHAPPGSVPAAALFAVGEPRAIPAAGNARDATGAPIATVALAITDPAAVMASDYALEPDAALPGQYRLTRLSDGLVRTIASGATVDGVRIAIGPPAPAAGESFLLQPVSRAANFTQRLLADPRDLAAASPLVATASSANIGTGAVASLTMTAPPGQPQAVAQVAFTDDAGAYAWTLTDPGTGTVLASGTGTWQPGQPIPQPPVAINGFALQLSGVPRNGDTFAIEPVTADTVASNNGNALAMAALRDGGLVGGATATDAWASAMADIGVRVQGADVAASISTAVAAETERQRSSGAGVDLDEEAARLIQFQQSYQAAAKVLQVAQAMFDTLLQTAAR